MISAMNRDQISRDKYDDSFLSVSTSAPNYMMYYPNPTGLDLFEYQQPSQLVNYNNTMRPASSGHELRTYPPQESRAASSPAPQGFAPSPIGQPFGYFFPEPLLPLHKPQFEEVPALKPKHNTSPSSGPGVTLTKNGRVNKQGKTKRSRMGCLTCRGRKKRCCERKPTCAECERLGLKCNWPIPGMEYRNRSKNNKFVEDRDIVETPFGRIKVLRGVVSKKT